jgi:hypothetical protein
LAIPLAGCAHLPSDFYPIGIYGLPETSDLAVVKAAGFNLVTAPPSRQYLQAAKQQGLKVLASLGTSAGPNFDAGAARAAVSQLDRHPALWAWYLTDEPDLNLVPPRQVAAAQRFLKNLPTRKPTALALFQGHSALDYGSIADITILDRYPIPWLPLANFPQHVRLARAAVGPSRPLLVVIQAFDWSYFPDLLPPMTGLRPPTFDELRCMTYCALAERANGLLYYAYQAGQWSMAEHPDTWTALYAVVREVNQRLPLFRAEHVWWPKEHGYADPATRYNAALESSVASVLLRVRHGSSRLPAGHYILGVNTTGQRQVYSFTLPWPTAQPPAVFEEARSLNLQDNWATDEYLPYAVHVYGPLAQAQAK